MRAFFVAKLCVFLEVLIPGRGGEAVIDLFHRDAPLDRTDDLAEVTADTLALIDMRDPRPFSRVNALMRAIMASDDAELTADTFTLIDLGDDLIVQIEVTPVRIMRE